MLRRGRIYGEPLDTHFNIDNLIAEGRKMYPDKKSLESLPEDADKEVPTTRGLHFICLVSDIERQFEFVQNVWANTSTFADLCNEVDPVISPRPTDDQPHCHEFTAPQELVRNRYQQVPEFTTVTGGAYFFMPGINALKYILK
jgi:deferrochelatase/peroxidase EfeB